MYHARPMTWRERWAFRFRKLLWGLSGRDAYRLIPTGENETDVSDIDVDVITVWVRHDQTGVIVAREPGQYRVTIIPGKEVHRVSAYVVGHAPSSSDIKAMIAGAYHLKGTEPPF